MYEVSWVITRNRSTEVMERTQNRIDMQLESGCQRILMRAQEAIQVRTGYTRDTGRVVKDARMQYRVVFGGAAIFLEFGTVHHEAFPFLIPAAMAERQQILIDVGRQVGSNVRSDYLAHAVQQEGAYAA